jgi:hypothetical protein
MLWRQMHSPGTSWGASAIPETRVSETPCSDDWAQTSRMSRKEWGRVSWNKFEVKHRDFRKREQPRVTGQEPASEVWDHSKTFTHTDVHSDSGFDPHELWNCLPLKSIPQDFIKKKQQNTWRALGIPQVLARSVANSEGHWTCFPPCVDNYHALVLGIPTQSSVSPLPSGWHFHIGHTKVPSLVIFCPCPKTTHLNQVSFIF